MKRGPIHQTAIDVDAAECFRTLSEALKFLHAEFLRLATERGLHSEDFVTALAGLAISAIDGLRAALLLFDVCDFLNGDAALRRFEEHFALMVYFVLCDDGRMLTKWFQNPKTNLTDTDPELGNAIDRRAENLFRFNPGYSFQDSLREMIQTDEHATWNRVQEAIVWAAGGYCMSTPEARNAAWFAKSLGETHVMMVQAIIGPSVGRFAEFLRKEIFTKVEFSGASPGPEYLLDLENRIFDWWERSFRFLQERNRREDHAENGGKGATPADGDDGAGVTDTAFAAGGDTIAPFENEEHRLAWLIDEIEQRVTGVTIEPLQPFVLFCVTSSWFETALTQAKAILELARHDLHAGSGPLHRALWELWIDWQYLLRIGDKKLNAAKVILNAKLEALEYIEGLQSGIDARTLTRLKEDIRKFEIDYPIASTEIRTQRKKRHFHWSGVSHSRMEEMLNAQTPSLYRLFSWEAHGVMSPIRDVRVRRRGNTVWIHFGQEEQNMLLNPRFLPFSSGGVLFYIYNKYAELWGLRPVVLPRQANDSKLLG